MAAGTLTAEKLTQLCLDRIQAYDRAGPKLHAIITLNPKALETARALDVERKAKGPRSPLQWHPCRVERQLRHLRHADHRTIGAARG
jgi:amidase